MLLILGICHQRVPLKAIALSDTAWMFYHLQAEFLKEEIIEMLPAWKLLSPTGVS